MAGTFVHWICPGVRVHCHGAVAWQWTAVQVAGNATVTPTLCVSESRSSGTAMVSV